MVDTLKAVIGDVKYFLAFLVLTFYSFAASFHILFRKDQKDIQVRGWWSYKHLNDVLMLCIVEHATLHGPASFLRVCDISLACMHGISTCALHSGS
jgi:hypothetical protein